MQPRSMSRHPIFIPKLSPTDDALVYAVLAGALWIGVAIVAIRERRVPRTLQVQAGQL
jgi:hypothetical protein